jgi:hypothetical protein
MERLREEDDVQRARENFDRLAGAGLDIDNDLDQATLTQLAGPSAVEVRTLNYQCNTSVTPL